MLFYGIAFWDMLKPTKKKRTFEQKQINMDRKKQLIDRFLSHEFIGRACIMQVLKANVISITGWIEVTYYSKSDIQSVSFLFFSDAEAGYFIERGNDYIPVHESSFLYAS